MNTTPAITVLLADDHAIVREGMRTLLDQQPQFKVVGEATNGHEAIALVAELKPAVVVMDIAMPLLNGFEATRQILAASPKSRVLALSAHADDEYVERMMTVGGAGFLLKQNSGKVLVKAIEEVAAGRNFFCPAVARRRDAAARWQKQQGEIPGPRQRPLTTREAEILQRLVEGAPNKLMAAELGISIKTVEKHRQSLMNKLCIHDTAGLTRFAIATGVIESSAQESTKGPDTGSS